MRTRHTRTLGVLATLATLAAPGCTLATPFGSFVVEDDAGRDAASLDAGLESDAGPTRDAASPDADSHDAAASDAPASYDLRLTIEGAGSVTGVRTDPCTGSCMATFLDGTPVVLAATTDAAHTFAGWSGDCTGMGDCMLTMDATHDVTARFVSTPRTLTVDVPTGGGSVRTVPPRLEIDCPGTCSAIYDDGTVVALEAIETSAFRFVMWTGACTGAGACTVTMTDDRSVGAVFERRHHDVTVAFTGVGTGTVTGGGFDCSRSGGGSTCVVSVLDGDPLSLAAAPAGGGDFDGWSGPCTGTASCDFTVTAPTTVTANFGPRRFDVTVENAVGTTTSAGLGRVLGVVAGTTVVSCPDARCTVRIAEGATLQLMAVADTAYRLGAWSGAGCAGSGACMFAVVRNETVRATYVRQRTLTITQSAGYPAGNTIEAWSLATNTPLPGVPTCSGGTGCSFVLDEGTTVRVSILRSPRWQGVTSWSAPGCEGPTCDVTLSADATVSFTTGPLGRLVFLTSMPFDGDLMGSPMPAAMEADAICQAIATTESFPAPTTYRAWLSGTGPGEDVATRFAGAQGAWVRTDGTPFAASLAEVYAARLLNAPGLDEHGVRYFESAAPWHWSNTRDNGTVFSTVPAETCGNFTLTSPAGNFAAGIVGSAGAIGSRWTSHPTYNSPCSATYPLVCFQIDAAPATPILRGPRLATEATPIFISSATFQGNAGRTAMDTACASEAGAAGLPGSYVAFLGQAGSPPMSVTSRLFPWVRVDGWPAVTNVTVSDTFAQIALRASGARFPLSEFYVWTGSAALPTSAGADHCTNWTSNTANGAYGDGSGTTDWYRTAISCSNTLPVYCVRR